MFLLTANCTSISVPPDGLGLIAILPSCTRTISLTSASPRPTPPSSRLLDLSTRKKGSNESQGAKYRNLSIDSSSNAGKYASDIMAFPTTILVDRNGNIVGDPMLGGIDNKDNYDSLMKQIKSVIAADSNSK